jgi:histidine ammonia-lyase
MANDILKLNGNSLSVEDIYSFIHQNKKIQIDKEAAKNINKSRTLVDKWVNEEKVIYGVTTGFGEFSNVSISKKDIEQLQENLIVSHAVGCGEPLPPFIVKIMMLLRVNALAKGYSGIRLSTMQTLVEMINQNIIPVIPSQGSVGSSGDLVQLSHLVLALIGKGKVNYFKKSIFDSKEKERVFDVKSIFKKMGLSPVRLKAKEGLALINGTQMMTAFASYITARGKRLNKVADIAASLSHEALRATDRAFDERIHNLRAYEGQSKTAKNLLAMIKGSEIRDSHRSGDPRVQDAYSIRCIPQIHGASRDAIEYVNSRVSIEINSANDNPLIFAETEEHLEGGNFHGQPMALAMDFMGIALAELANVSERRIERMVNGALNQGLPRFLTSKGGLNSGMMIAQYTAASLVSENKVLAHPASVDSIPTSANQEDHNSMGSIAAQKCYKILANLENVLAIELMVAAQALEFLKPLKPGIGTAKAYAKIREVVKPLNEDRILHYDLMNVLKLVQNDSLLTSVEEVVELL